MKWLYLLIALPILLMSGACTKDNGSYDIQSSFLEWTLFNEGSTWIFVNETSGKIDTNVVNGPVFDYYYPDSPPAYQHFDLGVTSRFAAQDYVHRGKNDLSYLHVVVKPPFATSGDMLCQSVGGDFVAQVSGHCRLVAIYPSLTLHGHTFSNVVRTRDSTMRDSTATVVDFYFAKKIGLIKLEARRGDADSVWSLVNWKVGQ
jgi:hypothetical protein